MRALVTILAAASCVAYGAGCGGGKCGLILQPGITKDGGFAAFSSVPVGGSATTDVPIQDSAPVDETVTGSGLTGNDAAAFKVLSTFPVSLPAGTGMSVAVQFSPRHTGTSTATLGLYTAAMGESFIALEGSTP